MHLETSQIKGINCRSRKVNTTVDYPPINDEELSKIQTDKLLAKHKHTRWHHEGMTKGQQAQTTYRWTSRECVQQYTITRSSSYTYVNCDVRFILLYMIELDLVHTIIKQCGH
jgi:hypothetical protein